MKKDDLKISIQREGVQSFLAIRPDEKMQIIGYCRDMLEKNTIRGLLPLSCQNLNGEMILRYPIHGLVSIREYFRYNHFEKEEGMLFLRNLISAVKRPSDYFLKISNCILDAEYAYIGDGMQAELVCVPVQSENEKAEDELREFLIDVTGRYLAREDKVFEEMADWLRNNRHLDMLLFEKEFFEDKEPVREEVPPVPSVTGAVPVPEQSEKPIFGPFGKKKNKNGSIPDPVPVTVPGGTVPGAASGNVSERVSAMSTYGGKPIAIPGGGTMAVPPAAAQNPEEMDSKQYKKWMKEQEKAAKEQEKAEKKAAKEAEKAAKKAAKEQEKAAKKSSGGLFGFGKKKETEKASGIQVPGQISQRQEILSEEKEDGVQNNDSIFVERRKAISREEADRWEEQYEEEERKRRYGKIESEEKEREERRRREEAKLLEAEEEARRKQEAEEETRRKREVEEEARRKQEAEEAEDEETDFGDDEETEFGDELRVNVVYLVHNDKKIPVRTFPFVIGQPSVKYELNYRINNRKVSHRHAGIDYKDGQYWIEDYGSKNGSMLNDRRLEKGIPEVLSDGDKISLYNETLYFHVK